MEKPVDILVVGGGVFGLWIAKRAVEAGLSAALVEKRRIGAGASGGLLGALAAFAPAPWSDAKQFQFEALLSLPREIAALEAETGVATGYARVGRLAPIHHPEWRARLERRAVAAAANWRMAETGLSYGPRAAVDADATDDDGWLSLAAAPEGWLYDSLAARIAPRAYLAALTAWLRPRARLIEGAGYAGWDGAAALADGTRLAAGAVALAAGFESFAMIEALTGRDAGGGRKGQTTLLRPPPGRLAPDAPIVTDSGVYVVAHADGTVAVGGANADDWSDPAAADLDMAEPLAVARRLCPALEDADIVAQWAGVRPRCWRRDPLLGRLPTAAPLWVATGGYGVGLGLAHRLAEALIDQITGRAPRAATPQGFSVAAHLG